MFLLYGLVIYRSYLQRLERLDQQIFSEMRIFSYKPTSKTFQVSFSPRDASLQTLKLLHDREGVSAYFPIPGSRKYLMKVSLPAQEYQQRIRHLRMEVLSHFPLYLILIVILAVLFSLYALHPFKKALELNEEFIRDLLHDVNTPLSSLRINLKILRKRYGEDPSIGRMENNIKTIQGMQKNLQSFLERQPLQSESFALKPLLSQRVEHFSQLYAQVHYRVECDDDLRIDTNREAFLRIIDNLFGNAGKYNVPGGWVKVSVKDTHLIIEDSGVGIAHPEKVFERYYREGERGLGLGLHIVKKLCEDLGISIHLSSEKGRGTLVRLDLSGVIKR